MAKRNRILMLGQLCLEVDSAKVSRFRTYKTGALLAFLAYSIDRPVPREELVEMLWPDTPAEQARNSLSQSLSSLRHLLETGGDENGPALESGRHSIRLLRERCETDVEAFRSIAKLAKQAQIRHDLESWEARAIEAASHFAGEFLPGIYEDWTLAPREHLREESLSLLSDLIKCFRQRNDLNRALTLAHQAITIEPTREEFHRSAIECYDLLGKPEASLKQYRELEKVLGRQLGLKPSIQTKEVVRESLRRERPSLEVSRSWRLPGSTTAFFGRGDEVTFLTSVVTSHVGRVITITGIGGIGKTRLALEVGRIVQDSYSDGATFVDLQSAKVVSDLWWAMLSAHQVSVEATSEPRAQVLRVLQNAHRLVILDNFEQLCDGEAPAAVAQMRDACPGVVFVISSRRRLNIEGEMEVSLAPLPVPDEGRNQPNDPSVALFLDRAGSVMTEYLSRTEDLDLIAKICRQLEGIPLAIELAAARVNVLSPAQILSRMSERLDLLASSAKVERHRSLRNMIEWSYCALPEHLQRSLRRLACFVGGWHEEAAEEVLSGQIALDVLADLRNFSLIVSEESEAGRIRFTMFEAIRDFALQETPEDELSENRLAHAHAILTIVQQFDAQIESEHQAAALNTLRTEMSNVRQAVETAIAERNGDLALSLCAASQRSWHLLAHLQEGLDLAARALRLPSSDGTIRAKVHNGLGRHCFLAGRPAEAEEHHREAVRSDPSNLQARAASNHGLAAIAYSRGDYQQALQLLESVLELRRALGDDYGVGATCHWLGIVRTEQGDFKGATDALIQGLAVQASLGDLGGQARTLNSLGLAAFRDGRVEEADYHYRKALDFHRKLGKRDLTAASALLANLAEARWHLGQHEEAWAFLDEAFELVAQAGTRTGLAPLSLVRSRLLFEAGQLDEAAGSIADAIEFYGDMSNRWGIASALAMAHDILTAVNHPAAKECRAAAKQIRRELEITLSAWEAARARQWLAESDNETTETSWECLRGLCFKVIVALRASSASR